MINIWSVGINWLLCTSSQSCNLSRDVPDIRRDTTRKGHRGDDVKMLTNFRRVQYRNRSFFASTRDFARHFRRSFSRRISTTQIADLSLLLAFYFHRPTRREEKKRNQSKTEKREGRDVSRPTFDAITRGIEQKQIYIRRAKYNFCRSSGHRDGDGPKRQTARLVHEIAD